jgi:hypothetical protein
MSWTEVLNIDNRDVECDDFGFDFLPNLFYIISYCDFAYSKYNTLQYRKALFLAHM